MNFFDLHCDTIYECATKGKQLQKNDLHLDLERGNKAFSRWVQTFAFWIPDELPEEEQYAVYRQELACFRGFEEDLPALRPYDGSAVPGGCSYLLAVEGGGMLGDSLERLTELKAEGISLLTLTWNGENRIGGGAKSAGRLTPFGEKVIREAEQLGIVLDVSHLNRETFWDVCRFAKRPFIATHSNADAVCPHPRNLTREQIRELVGRDGLIGLNLFHAFLSPGECVMDDFLRQIEYFLEQGAGCNLAIGTDFDGAVLPNWINGVEGIENLAQHVVKWFDEEICRRIFYENAERFCRQYIFRREP